MKKIKNPELYIKRLKKQIKDLEEWRKIDMAGKRHTMSMMDRERIALKDRIQRAKGRVVVIWAPHEEVQSAGSFALATLRPNDRIAIIGQIKKVESWAEDGCDNQHSSITYNVLETRKIEE